MSPAGPTDGELVARSCAGEREAFGEIVARYQSLVCSLAYSATGSVSLSEDLAQETFLAAWQHIGKLQAPDKLRGWLCGIARNTIHNARRARGREPSTMAASMDTLATLPATDASPSAEAIRRDEQSLVWRALTQLPDIYREPLILFYREQESVESVAAALELSEEVVRQRLSRGRKLLHAEVAAVVEGALKQSRPGRAFTESVLSALPLPLMGGAAGTKTASAAAVKGSLAFGGLGSALGTLGGLFGWWLPAQIQVELAQSSRERKFMLRVKWLGLAEMIAYMALVRALVALTDDWRGVHPVRYALMLLALNAGFVLALLAESFWWVAPTLRRIRREENSSPSAFEIEMSKSRWLRLGLASRNYRTPQTLLGLPLVDIRINRRPGEKFRPACGWIAVGDVAIGGLFAMGGVAIAPISSAGLAIGGLALGGAAVGGWAIGGWAAGIVAIGGGAIAWRAALGGFAVARDFAFGGVAYARHANDAAARAVLHMGWFETHFAAFVVCSAVLQLALIVGWLYAFRTWKKRARATQAPASA